MKRIFKITELKSLPYSKIEVLIGILIGVIVITLFVLYTIPAMYTQKKTNDGLPMNTNTYIATSGTKTLTFPEVNI